MKVYQQAEQSFKGIALFTPGGDLFYCIDLSKQSRWHLHLCLAIQETLGLTEPPHFLSPGYTATVDRWIIPSTGQLKTATSIYPRIKSYQPLLNAIFNLAEDFTWEIAPWREEICNPIALETYRQRFPELWESHELVVKVESAQNLAQSPTPKPETQQGYTLLLFISNQNLVNPETLHTIHQILEEGLHLPYTLKIIDIVKYPEQAEKFRISATPTLVRIQPKPTRHIIGEFENWQQVLQILTS